MSSLDYLALTWLELSWRLDLPAFQALRPALRYQVLAPLVVVSLLPVVLLLLLVLVLVLLVLVVLVVLVVLPAGVRTRTASPTTTKREIRRRNSRRASTSRNTV